MLLFAVVLVMGMLSHTRGQPAVCPEEAAAHACGCDVIADRVLEIDCESRGLTEVPDFTIFKGLPICFLTLARNQIKSLPQGFLDGMHFHAYVEGQDPNLDLSSNAFRSIDDDAFTGMKANTLGLRLVNTSLGHIPTTALSKMENFTFLLLHENQIDMIGDNAFQGLKKVRKLQLSKNPIREISGGAFAGLQGSLRDVYLSSTSLSSVPSAALQSLSQLVTLELEDNDIVIIDERTFSSFSTKESLKLNLQQNGLERLNPGAFTDAGFKLRLLQLQDNALTDVSFLSGYCEGVYDKTPTVHLENNPVVCTCDLLAAVESDRVTLQGVCGEGNSYADLDLEEEFPAAAAADCGLDVTDTTCAGAGDFTTSLWIHVLLALACVFI